MNNVQMSGRAARNPEVRYTSGQNAMAIAHLTLAVDRKYKRDGDPTADFISCKAFGKTAELLEKYVTKGTKIIVSKGRIETGSYTNKDNVKVYTTDVIIEEWEFAESKKASADDQAGAPSGAPQKAPAQPRPRPAEPAPTDFFSDPFAEDPFGDM